MLNPTALLLALALAASPATALAENDQTGDLDQRVRCAAIFAVLARDQNNKLPGSEAYPPVDKPGEAFFIATGQRLFAERKVDEQTVRSFFVNAVEKFQKETAEAQNPKAHFAASYNSCAHYLQAEVPVPKR